MRDHATYLTHEVNIICNHFCNEYKGFEKPFQRQKLEEYRREWVNFMYRKRDTNLASFIRYLLTNTTHEIANFIHYAVPIVLFPLTSVEAERLFSQLKIVKTK